MSWLGPTIAAAPAVSAAAVALPTLLQHHALSCEASLMLPDAAADAEAAASSVDQLERACLYTHGDGIVPFIDDCANYTQLI